METLGFIVMLAQLFSQPTYIPTNAVSHLWVLPICLSISLVYKAIKIKTFKPGLFIREVLFLFGTIVGFLIFIAVCFLGIAWWIS